MTNFLVHFLKVIKSYTDEGMPLHRAKALKWASECRAIGDGKMGAREKELLWQQALTQNLVQLDERGNLIGLSEQGESVLSRKERDQ